MEGKEDEMKEIARAEEGKEMMVWRGYGKLRIDGQWWKWNEVGEGLRDGRGRMWEERQGEEKEGGCGNGIKDGM